MCICAIYLCLFVALLGWLGFSKREGDVAMLYHVGDLPLHGDEEEHNEVEEQDGPKDGNVEKVGEGHAKGCNHGPGARVPKLELGQPSRERPKLFSFPRREPQVNVVVFGVKLRRQKPNQLVQQINPQAIRNNVPPIANPHSQDIKDAAHQKSPPSRHDMRR